MQFHGQDLLGFLGGDVSVREESTKALTRVAADLVSMAGARRPMSRHRVVSR
jgi:hypothetical protein